MYKVKLDGKYIYHPWSDKLSLSAGKLTQELNKNGTFDFSIPFAHPLAGSVQRRKSVVEVTRFRKNAQDEVIYRGCCMNDTGNTGLELEVESDGDLVFLMESIMRPYTGTLAPGAYFKQLIQQHNAQIDDIKRFAIGAVNVTGDAKKRTRETYCTTREALDELIEECGGYIRTRTVGATHYIDYIASYGSVSAQGVRHGQNIIDITKYVNTDDLATRIVPVGATSNNGLPLTIKSVNNGLDYIQDDSAVSEFGIIAKVVEFPDISEPSRLLQAGKEHLEAVKGANLTVELTAVDMADAGYDIDAIDVGDLVPCVARAYGINTQMQVSKKVTDILNPANSRITLGSTVRTLTQKQLGDNAGILPMVRKATNTAAVAAGAASQAESSVQDMQQQVEALRNDIPAVFTGASANSAGTHGQVPAPSAGEQDCVLFGRGFWDKLILSADFSNTNGFLQLSFGSGDDAGYSRAMINGVTSQNAGLMSPAHKAKLDKILGTDNILYTSATGIYASSLQTWAYGAVSGLSLWQEVRMWIEVGDGSRGYHTFTRAKNIGSASAYVSTSYYGCMQISCDFASNKIGVYVTAKNGWDFTKLRVTRVEGVVKS